MIAVLMCSFTVFASAANEEMQLGKTYTVTVGQNSKTLSFTPDSDGVYEISAKLLDKDDCYIDITVASEENNFAWVGLSYSSYYDEDFNKLESSDIFVVKKGIALTIEIEKFIDIDDGEIAPYGITDTAVELKIEKSNVKKLDLGDTFTVNNDYYDTLDNYFYIIPEETMQYNFWSYFDGTVAIMDGCGNYYSDDLSVVLGSIDYTEILEKGEIYLVRADIFFQEDGPSSAVINIADGSKISPQVISMDSVLAIKGEDTYQPVAVYPFGSRYNYETLELTMGDTGIASAEYDKETGEIIVHGNKLGTTTLTVTEPISGVTAEVEVKVVTRIGYFFINVFQTVYEIISEIFGF